MLSFKGGDMLLIWGKLSGRFLGSRSFVLLRFHARRRNITQESKCTHLDLRGQTDLGRFVFGKFINQTGCKFHSVLCPVDTDTSGPDGIAWLLGVSLPLKTYVPC